jgi:hypothetical protein
MGFLLSLLSLFAFFSRGMEEGEESLKRKRVSQRLERTWMDGWMDGWIHGHGWKRLKAKECFRLLEC